MAGFAPSASAAATALAGRNVIVQKVHPGGAKGVKFSLAEVAARTKEGRNDPRIKGWAGRVLISAGKPKGVKAQMQALLDAFRKQTMYVPDPVQTELITKPSATLCLDELGLCMPAGDCDCRVVCLGSVGLSIGIDVKIIGQAFNYEPIESHVIFAVRDPELGWLKIDPSHDNWPVGRTAMATKETELDPMADPKTGLSGSNDSPGDFIGIGHLPGQSSCARDGECVGSDAYMRRHFGGQFGVGQPPATATAAPPATYVLGQNTIPANAPVGAIVQEQPGSPYVTTCTKQVDGSWTCTNGSTFAPGQLEHLTSVTCPAGQTFVSPGLCVPSTGLLLASGATLMPNGSYYMPDGGVLSPDGTYRLPDGTTVSPGGQVTMSVSAEISNALAAAEQLALHPFQTGAAGAAAIGQGAGNIAGSAVAGFAQGLLHPTNAPTGGTESLTTSLQWIGALAAAVAGVYVLAPVVKEVIATRQESRMERGSMRAKPAAAEPRRTVSRLR